MESKTEIEVARPGVGNEPDSRTGMGLNCAAWLGATVGNGRECKRKARKGDYCVQHWLMNYGHEFNLLTLECKCGVKWGGVTDEICEKKVTYITVSLGEVKD